MITLLIVDDEKLVRENIKFILNEIPLKTCIIGEAENGEEAFDIYRRYLPDVVITDVKMPEMNGIELIEKIRKTDQKTQIIIISGYADFKYAQTAIKNGVVQYVLKPIKNIDFEEALKKCMINIEENYREILTKDEQLIKYIQDNYSCTTLSLDKLADEFNFNPKYISWLIKNKLGETFTEYVLMLRMKKAIELLTKTSINVKVIAMSVGYDDQHYFHRVFKRSTGKTPIQYRNETKS